MKISEIFNLNKTQSQLDFVDIDVDKDIPLFIDSNLIRKCSDEFYVSMQDTMDSFFDYLIGLLAEEYYDKARLLCTHLSEVNETHLGVSKGKSRGKGVGPINSEKIFNALIENQAIKERVLENVEDLRVLIRGFDKDLLSDMLTNILKEHLIRYTQSQCELHNIPLTQDVPSGFFWDSQLCRWDNKFTTRLIINDKPILLIPKRIVSYCLLTSSSKYRQHFVLNFLQEENIINKTSLVRKKKKTNELFVYKKDIIKTEQKMDKEYLTQFTIKHPEILKKFKEYNLKTSKVLSGNIFDNIKIDDICSILLEQLNNIKTGSKHASDYHNLMIGILELLSYPSLSNPKKETNINDGRKRIDITYANCSSEGFFNWVWEKAQVICPSVFVECKNYSTDISNPELDQMIGRFSPRRGKLGIIACRSFDDEELFIKRCIDSFKDDHGLILPISDKDIIACLCEKDNCSTKFESILFEKARRIIDG